MNLERAQYELFRGKSGLCEAQAEFREVQVGFPFRDRARGVRSEIPFGRGDGRFRGVCGETTFGKLLPGRGDISGHGDRFGVRKLPDFLGIRRRTHQGPFVIEFDMSPRGRGEIGFDAFVRGGIRMERLRFRLYAYERIGNMMNGHYGNDRRNQL